MNFSQIFTDYINKKTNNQILIVDKICEDAKIDANLFFKFYLKQCNSYTGTDLFNEILSDFLYYLHLEFVKVLMIYVPIKGVNIHNEPYIDYYLNLKYLNKKGLTSTKKSSKKFRKLNLTFSQKEELMKNYYFSYIVNQTKLKIYSKKDIRVLKLKSLNECSRIDNG